MTPTLEQEATHLTARLELEAQMSGQPGARLTVACGPASVSLDEEALRALLEKAGGELTLSVRAAETHTLTQAQAQAAGEWPAYHLEVRSGGENIARFGQGLARVSLPYEGEGPVQVLHLDEEGAFSPRTTWQEEGRVIFETGHFSVYAIAPATAGEEPLPEAPAAEAPEGQQGESGSAPAGGPWLAARLGVLGLLALGLAALGRKRA